MSITVANRVTATSDIWSITRMGTVTVTKMALQDADTSDPGGQFEDGGQTPLAALTDNIQTHRPVGPAMASLRYSRCQMDASR